MRQTSTIAATLVVATQLVACGDAGTPQRSTLRIEARRPDRSPVPGVVFALDHAGGRIEGTTDEMGAAVVAAPDWSAGSVDLTYGGPAAASLVSLLGIPPTATLTIDVEAPHPTQRTLSGNILHPRVDPYNVVLSSVDVGSCVIRTGSATYELPLESTAATRLVGAEIGNGDTSERQRFVRWFTVPVVAADPATGGVTALDVDLDAAQPLPTTAVTASVPIADAPRGAISVDMWFIGANGLGWLGGPVRAHASADGSTYEVEGEVANVEGVPPMTLVSVAPTRFATSIKVLAGLPTGPVTGFLPVPAVTSPVENGAGFVADASTTFELGQVPDGIDATGLVISSSGCGEAWRVDALDRRASIRVPSPPTGIADPRTGPPTTFAQAFFCEGRSATLHGCTRYATSEERFRFVY